MLQIVLVNGQEDQADGTMRGDCGNGKYVANKSA
jgi:hypothetical protein